MSLDITINALREEQQLLKNSERTQKQTDFEKFRAEREQYRYLYGKISEEKVEEAGELLKKLYCSNKSSLARHIFLYFHLETKKQLKSDKRYSHLIKAMSFTSI